MQASPIKRTVPASMGDSRLLPAQLRDRARSLVRIWAVAFSATYFLLTLRLGREVLSFVSANAIGVRNRTYMVAWLLLLPTAVTAGAALIAQRQGAEGVALLATVSRLTLPMLGMGALPALLMPGLSDDRELVFLVVVGLVALLVERTMRSALDGLESLGAGLIWPARLPARAWDLAAAAVVVGYIVMTGVASIRLHYKLLTSIFDLGLFENLFYNTLHGRHGVAVGRAYFGEHAEFLLYPLLPIYALIPRTETLLILQSLFLGGAAVPLYLLARRWIGRGQALAAIVIYLLYPAVHGPNFYDFHFLTLSVFFVSWAAYCFFVRRWMPFWIFVLLALSSREDVALGAAAIGGCLAVGRWRRTGIVLTLLSATWLLLVKFVWMQQFATQSFSHYYSQLIPPGEKGFAGVLRTAISNPLTVLFSVLVPEKLLLGMHLLVPLVFLPVRERKAAFLLLPGLLVLGLATSRAAVLQIHFHYVCHFVPYVFLAFIIGLAERPPRARTAILSGALVATAACTVQFGALFRERYKASYHEVSFDWTPMDEANWADLETLMGEIPPTASVTAGEYEGPHLARRLELRSIKEGTQNSDFVLVGTQSLRWGGTAAAIEALSTGAYGLKAMRGPFVLLAKGVPTTGNAETIAWLRAHPPR